jgi:AraC-like DNA-binding protein
MGKEIRLLSKQIYALMSSNPRMTLQETAKAVGINRCNIETALQKQYGYSFRELRNQVRLKYALDHLFIDASHLSLKEIAAALDIFPNNLSRFIRRMTGCCASELRTNKNQVREQSSILSLLSKAVGVSQRTIKTSNDWHFPVASLLKGPDRNRKKEVQGAVD